jgi:hypothetical protein
MGQLDQDFEKGDEDGTADALRVLEAICGGSLGVIPAAGVPGPE